MKTTPSLRPFLLGSAISLVITAAAFAGNTWDGGAGSGLWNAGDNWNVDGIPTTGVALTFAGDVQNGTSNDLAATDPSFAGILFTNSGAVNNTNAFILEGSRITLGGNITTSANTAGATITDEISLNMILNGNHVITTNQQSATVQHNLTISGDISEDAAGRTLTKAGSGTLTLSGANSYTGRTMVSGGTLVVTSMDNVANPNPLGQSSAAASNLLIGNTSTLKYTTGGTASTDRGFTLNNGPANGNIFTLDASGAGAISWTNTASPAFQNTGYLLNLILTGTNADDNTLAANIANNGTGAVGIKKEGAGTWVLSGANTYTGQTFVTDGTLKLTGNRTVAPTTAVGIAVNGSNAILEIGGDFYADNEQITVAGGGIINQTAGDVAFLGGASYGGNQLVIGTTSTGTYNLSGGSLTTTGSSGENRGVIIASTTTSGTSTFNLSGTGHLNVSGSSGGSGYKNSVLDIIRSDNTVTTNSTATFNQTGGGSMASVSILRMGSGGTGNTANLNLSAGTFTAGKFDKLSFGGTSTSNINISGTAEVTLPEFPQSGLGTGSSAVITFDGGTLKNTAASANYLGVVTSAKIKAGGARIDTTGGNIAITQALVEDPGSTGGGLTKQGGNTLTLSGSNSYTDATTITGGTLALGASNVLADTTAVSIGSATLGAATFNDTVGTLDVTGNATIHIGIGGALAFANCSAVDWTGGTLNVTGTFIPGVSLRFGATSGGLLPAQLALITVNGGGGYALDSNGYLVASFAAWQTANATSGGMSADHDGDGVENGVEFFIHGPVANSGFTSLPGVVNSGGILSVTWTKATGYAGTYGMDFRVETSATLAAGSWVGAAEDTGADKVVISGNSVTYTFPAGTINFARLKVTGP